MLYLCAWPLVAGTLGAAAAGMIRGQGPVRAAAFIAGYFMAFLLLHLYGVPLSAELATHRLAIAFGGALLFLLEGLYLLGAPSLWGRLFGRTSSDEKGTDTGALVLLGAFLAFAGGVCGDAAAIAAAQALGHAGRPVDAFLVVLLLALGTALGLLALASLGQALLARLRHRNLHLRIAGALFVLLAGAIASGHVSV